MLERLHIILLSLIFIFGMKELNIFYIGLLFFSVIYVSSLASYRKSGKILIVYASFFIWIQYFWSLYNNDKGDTEPNDFVEKLFSMLINKK